MPKKGYKPTQEHKDKISVANMGHDAWNKGIPAWNRGIPRTKETKEKISKSLSGIKHYMFGKKRALKENNKNRNSLDHHHIWYMDNQGKSTDKGVWAVTKKRHRYIHSVLKHNLWVDNRRYLAG